jgi:hypothetical protein
MVELEGQLEELKNRKMRIHNHLGGVGTKLSAN